LEIVALTLLSAALVAARASAHAPALGPVTPSADPARVRAALHVGAGDRVLVTGGDEALDLLLENPAAVVAAHPGPLHLLELQRAAIRALHHSDLFALFGRSDAAVLEVRLPRLLEHLSLETTAFWTGPGAHLFRRNLFLSRDPVARCRAAALRAAALHPAARRLLEGCRDAPSLDAQRTLYGAARPLVDRLPDHLAAPIHSFFEGTWIARDPRWRARFYGAHSAASCPPWLRPENLPLLKARLDRLALQRGALDDVIAQHPVGWFTQVLALDDPPMSEDQIVDRWTTFQACAPDATFLLRDPPPGPTLASLSRQEVGGGLWRVSIPRRLRIFPRPAGDGPLRRLARAAPVIAGGTWVHQGDAALLARMGEEGVHAFGRVILSGAGASTPAARRVERRTMAEIEVLAGEVDLVTLSAPGAADIALAARLLRPGGFVAGLAPAAAGESLARAFERADERPDPDGGVIFLGRRRARGAEAAA